MEGVGASATVITVVDLSAKIATLCLQYSKKVASARADIKRLHAQVEHLKNALEASQRLLNGDTTHSLSTSQGLISSLRDCISELEGLEKRLGPSPGRTTMRRLGLRALKWPFSSKEVDQLLFTLERHEKTILLGLQIDQTAVLVDIQHRIQQLEIKPADDSSTKLRAYRMVPFPPNPDFVHRPGIEKWMQDQYIKQDELMALVGKDGLGKSQLAIKFAHHIYTDKPGTSVFWVQGASRATFEESYRALADFIELPRRHEPDVDVLALVCNWLQRDDIGPWLMIIDNADDSSLFKNNMRHNEASQKLLASYLPKSTNGRILVTSCNLDAAETLVKNRRAILQIPAMEETEAIQLLRKKLEDGVDEADAKSLVLALDCIPLAVGQAAAYISRRSPRVTVSSYLQEFRNSEERKDSLLRSDKDDLSRYDEVSNSVVVTWQVIFEQIRRERPSAANLLSLMSLFQPHNIPEEMLHDYNYDIIDDEYGQEPASKDRPGDNNSSREHFEDDLDVLQGYSLVAPSTVGFLEMHSLVQFCTRSWTLEFGDQERWGRLFVKLAADHFPSGEFETWETCQRLLPHIEPILPTPPKGQSILLNWAEILANVSRYLSTTGEYQRSEVLLKRAIQIKTNISGPNDTSTLRSRSYLARIFRNQGRFNEAEKLDMEVLQALKTKPGVNHLDTLASMNNLAMTLKAQGRFHEAEKLQMEVFETLKTKLGVNHLDTLTSMNNLAMTLKAQGRFHEAKKLQMEVLETRNMKLELNHPSMLMAMNNLAMTLKGQGRFHEAEKLQTEVLQAVKTKLGVNHPNTLTSMNNLAMIFAAQSRFHEAEKLHMKVFQTRKMKLGVDHPDTLTSMSNLATTRWMQGRFDEAEKLQIEVLHALKTKLGVDHPDTIISMSNLASTRRMQGRLDEAEKLQMEVVQTNRKTLGADHPDTVSSMSGLAIIWHSQGRAEDAVALMQNCLDLRRTELGHMHPTTQGSDKIFQAWQAASADN